MGKKYKNYRNMFYRYKEKVGNYGKLNSTGFSFFYALIISGLFFCDRKLELKNNILSVLYR